MRGGQQTIGQLVLHDQRNSDGTELLGYRQSTDFRKATATFPERSSIEESQKVQYLMTDGNLDHVKVPNNFQNLENRNLQSAGGSKEGNHEQVLGTETNVISEPQIRTVNGEVDTPPQHLYEPMSFANTNINSQQESRDQISGRVNDAFEDDRQKQYTDKLRKKYSDHSKKLKPPKDAMLINDRDNDQVRQMRELLNGIGQSNGSMQGSGRQPATKVILPSYRDDRYDRPTHIVRDSSQSQSSKNAKQQLTNRLSDTLQKQTDSMRGLQMIPSETEDEVVAQQ